MPLLLTSPSYKGQGADAGMGGGLVLVLVRVRCAWISLMFIGRYPPASWNSNENMRQRGQAQGPLIHPTLPTVPTVPMYPLLTVPLFSQNHLGISWPRPLFDTTRRK